MTNDASTAYICIYCPFNSDNLEALEHHLTNAHGYGCQDAPQLLTQSASSSNVSKAGKREAPDDEQSQSSLNGIKTATEHSSGNKRVKRTLSPPTSTSVFINGTGNNSESDDDNDFDDDDSGDEDEDEDDEHDSSNPATISPKAILTCPICSSTYHRLGHLLRHAKRKHHLDLSKYDGPHTFDKLTSQSNPMSTSDVHLDATSTEQTHLANADDADLSEKSSPQLSKLNNDTLPSSASDPSATTDCPYCDFKTTDIEQFKGHIIAHIRDKNYRCLLCNRLYKYRGDCSFHIRRKHHRYSTNSNDYIQRFLFDTADGDESTSKQSGGQHGTSLNTSLQNISTLREQDEPVRYFGCPYCDYTSNYGGDVRKHQARKHPNVESKVIKIIRQDSEHQISSSSSSTTNITTVHKSNPIVNNNFNDEDIDDSEDPNIMNKPNINLIEQQDRKEKIKTVKKTDPNFIQQHPSTLAIPPNFAPVRVFQCSSCHQQGTYKWVVERHIRAKHPDQPDVHVIELPAELAVKLQKITPPLKRFRCSLCPLQSKHTWVIIRHIKHFHTLQTASVLDIQPDGTPAVEEPYSFQNGDFSNKSFNQDSESSSPSSSCMETANEGQSDAFPQPDIDDEDDESDNMPSSLNSQTNCAMMFTYKCSLCDFVSHVSWNTQKHINEVHNGQPAHILTQCRPSVNDNNQKLSSKKLKHKAGSQAIATVTKIPIRAPLSPSSAIAKAKFSPAVEEALLSLQGSKINTGMYAVQPKFGIKRLKCRHCFYRSNWKTDMIRHVRIRHNMTEPDHNKDMILMTEQEARSTIETYENTFGKELRRRTFRTWNDWAKAEEEFTPKDGSLQYASPNNGDSPNDNGKPKKNSATLVPSSIASSNDEPKRINKTKAKPSTTIIAPNAPNTVSSTKEFKQLPNPSNIVSRLLLTTSPLRSTDDDAPLDLSLKPSSSSKTNHQIPSSSSLSQKQPVQQNGDNHNKKEKQTNNDHHIEQEGEEENSDSSSTVTYTCSACPYKSSSYSSAQHHLVIHLNGQGVICPLCSYAASSHNLILRHLKTVHPTSQTVNKFQAASRISTANIIEQHQCPMCPYQCDRSDALDDHRRRQHDDDEYYVDTSSSVDGEQEDEMDNEENDLTFDKNNNIFQCPVCTPTSNTNNFTNLEQFTVHVFTDHNNYIQNNQSCPFCSFIAHTTSKYSLTEHIKLHFNGTLVQPDPMIGIENVKELLIE